MSKLHPPYSAAGSIIALQLLATNMAQGTAPARDIAPGSFALSWDAGGLHVILPRELSSGHAMALQIDLSP